MSSQRGNTSRSRPQKYKNRTVFKNDVHDKSNKIKMINSIQVGDVCTRCRDIIEWKIKYKKYKPLSQAKTCVKCSQKSVKKAYHVICTECVKSLKVCAKCLQTKEILPATPNQEEQAKLDAEMKQLVQSFPERKRRTFLRYMNKQQKSEVETSKEEQTDDLKDKLNKLKLQEEDDNDDCNSFGFDFSGVDIDSDDEDGFDK